ncbi:MAG: methyltransferase domain-containing protein [SAR202 cluster bacterium]|nr:methyltransferase domain-containing protein [SAR202 cluster bacterium]
MVTPHSFIVPSDIEAYAAQHTTPLPPLLQELQDYTYKNVAAPMMLSGQLEGTLLQFLIRLSNAKRVLEIGMFTGFSAQMMAAALPDDGSVITCDIDPKAKQVAESFFRRSPHGKKIQVLLGPALQTLKDVKGPFDLVFIDADKENYTNYYELALQRLAPRGLIAVDNVLWSGRVLSPQRDSDRAIAAFNDYVQRDPRVTNVMLTIRDGLMLIQRV